MRPLHGSKPACLGQPSRRQAEGVDGSSDASSGHAQWQLSRGLLNPARADGASEPRSVRCAACAQVTAINLGGYLVAFFGVCWYNYNKLQAMKAKQAAAASSAALAKEDTAEEASLLGGGKAQAGLTKSPRQASP